MPKGAYLQTQDAYRKTKGIYDQLTLFTLS